MNHADSVTASEKATVWHAFHTARGARGPIPSVDWAPAPVTWRRVIEYGIFDLRDVAVIAEWVSYGEENWHEAVAMAAMWPHRLSFDRPDDALTTARLASFARVPVQNEQGVGLVRARTALGLMLDYLAEDQGEGVQRLYDFLGYVLRETD